MMIICDAWHIQCAIVTFWQLQYFWQPWTRLYPSQFGPSHISLNENNDPLCFSVWQYRWDWMTIVTFLCFFFCFVNENLPQPWVPNMGNLQLSEPLFPVKLQPASCAKCDCSLFHLFLGSLSYYFIAPKMCQCFVHNSLHPPGLSEERLIS